jgi:hypothetical protein
MRQNNETKKNLYEILDAMQERPALYLGGASITLVAAYILCRNQKNMGNVCLTMKWGFKYSNVSMDS